tara:strand:- start:50 stop:661 length:612 start_codon:yes stop_codon:yes gene_type:complete
MDFNSLIGLSLICAAGAVSPGPSLAVVVRNTISGGKTQGVLTGIGHGIGLGSYAFIAITGLSTIILTNVEILKSIQILGILVLIWISYNMLTVNSADVTKQRKNSGSRGFIEGFMIAFLNPKILVFLVAVFSQFINPQISNYDRILMAIIAGTIDTTWYVLVALILARTSIPDKLRKNTIIIDRTIGLVLISFSIVIIINLLN